MSREDHKDQNVKLQRPHAVQQKPRDLHPVVKWLRTTGIAAELFGWGGLLLPGWFWPAVASILGGFLLLAIDALLEPGLRPFLRWRIGIVAVLLLLMAAFSWGIVFVNAPLSISAFVTDAEYPVGTSIANIPWRPEFTELQVWIRNPSDRSYDDISLVIRPIEAIAAIAQLTNVPNVTFEDKNQFSLRLMAIKFPTKKAIPLVLLATDSGYRMRCPRLAAGAEINVVIALADIKWDPHPQLGRSEDEIVGDKNYIMRIKDDNFNTYWMGHAGADIYAPRPTSSDWIKIEGQYVAAQRVRPVSQKILVGGSVGMKRN